MRWQALSLCALLVAVPAPGHAAVAPSGQVAAFQPTVVGLYRPDAHPVWGAFERALAATGRVTLVTPRPAAAGPGPYAAALRAWSRPGVRPLAVVPAVSVGALGTTPPETRREDRQGGGFDATVTMRVTLPLSIRVVVQEADTGRVVEQVARRVTLAHPLSYSYTERTSGWELRRLANDLAQRVALERSRGAQAVFAEQLGTALEDLAEEAAEALVRCPTFRLVVPIARLDPARDRVYLGLGRNVRLRWDNGFAVMRGERQIGFVKVRELGEAVSGAQPLYVKAPFAVGDRLEEVRQAGIHGGPRVLAGLLPMAPQALQAPALGAGLALEADVAPFIPTSELYVTGAGAALWSPVGVGVMVEGGLARRFFVRQTALKLSGRGAVAVTGAGLLPGGALGLGLERHLHEYVHFSAEVDGLALMVPGGWAVSPLGRVGMTLVF